MSDPTRSQRLSVYGVSIVDDEILLVRASGQTEVPGRWFLPGGGVDHGEHPEVALLRELDEETGLVGSVGQLLGVLSDVRTREDGVHHHTVRLIYELTDVTGELLSEVSGTSDLAQWIPLSQASTYPIARYVQRACALLGVDLQSLK